MSYAAWGVLWVVAGAVGAVSPDTAGIGWLIVDIVGIAASGYLVVRNARRYSEDSIRIQGLRYAATGVVLAAFVAMTLMIFAPASGAEVQLFITNIIAAIYMIAGFWIGRRYAIKVYSGFFSGGLPDRPHQDVAVHHLIA